MDWFYANERDEQIKVGEDELKTLVSGGSIRPDTLVWNEDLPEWQPCLQVKPEWFSGTEGSQPEAAAAAAPATSPYPTTPAVVSSPAFQPPIPTAQPTDGLALASMICGITGLLFMFCYGAGIPISIAAVICGHLCRRRLLSEGNTSSAGLAMAGLITGYVGIALVVLFIGFFVAIFGLAAATSAATSGSMP
jgi:hypothetical protein